MAYNKHTWTTGETITAEKLNNIEGGVANAGEVLKLTFTESDGSMVCDHTWQEICDALMNGAFVTYPRHTTPEADMHVYQINHITTAIVAGGGYSIYDFDGVEYATDSADGYPSFEMDDGGGK